MLSYFHMEVFQQLTSFQNKLNNNLVQKYQAKIVEILSQLLFFLLNFDYCHDLMSSRKFTYLFVVSRRY